MRIDVKRKISMIIVAFYNVIFVSLAMRWTLENVIDVALDDLRFEAHT
jgi:hypothetical protein